ncbi:MAG: glycosyltransferase family 2 protein [Lachnospiraceae bacterium]|nr:glycosyltransferase family 2 protein [Lachnospiraceae bacterium]
MPYISVVVPVYNAENSIERCVSSIIGQGYLNMEILLIDDGSQDESGVLCEKLAEDDKRVRVIHKENAGVSAARNTGMDQATGKYILFVDSDDYLPENYVNELLRAQKVFGEEVFYWTTMQVVSDNNSVKEEKNFYSEEQYSKVGRKDVLKLSAKYLLNAPWNKMYLREVLQKNGLRMKQDISIAEDLLFNLQYLDAIGENPIVILNHTAYHYVRNGQASLDNGYRKNYYKIHKDVLRQLWQYTKKWQVPKEDMPLFYKRYWEYMQNAFSNLEYKNCSLSGFQKFVEKSRITADGYFQKSLVQRKDTMGRGSYLMWRSRIYLLVWLYEKIMKRG